MPSNFEQAAPPHVIIHYRLPGEAHRRRADWFGTGQPPIPDDAIEWSISTRDASGAWTTTKGYRS